METAPKPVLASGRATVSDAKHAYFEGDFEGCLQVCAEIRIRTVATASEVALLRARAYLRTGRPHEAQIAVIEAQETHMTLDASLTAQMLVATARIRQDDPDMGITMLEDAAARSSSAHFAIRSEIALCTALGYWAKREIDVAQQYLATVDPRSDIIHARALELSAWCAAVRRDYRQSADYFRQTILRLEECRAADRIITATAISTLAIYAAELFDPELADFVAARLVRFEWPANFGVQRFTTLLHQALYEELAGNTIAAYEAAMASREYAPTIAFHAFALGTIAKIAYNARETKVSYVWAKQAQELLDSLDVRQLSGEERFAMLIVAESCAHFDTDRAAELFASYWRLAPVDPMLALAGDPRVTADEAFLEGVIAQASNDRGRARTAYGRAFDLFRSIGYVSRAAASAAALLELVETHDAGELRRYIEAHLGGKNNYITRVLRPVGSAVLAGHPIFASLPAAQQEVVVLISKGQSNKAIAISRGVRAQTVKNMITKNIFPAFGVSTRAELLSAFLH